MSYLIKVRIVATNKKGRPHDYAVLPFILWLMGKRY